jgi:hypothetical protein
MSVGVTGMKAVYYQRSVFLRVTHDTKKSTVKLPSHCAALNKTNRAADDDQLTLRPADCFSPDRRVRPPDRGTFATATLAALRQTAAGREGPTRRGAGYLMGSGIGKSCRPAALEPEYCSASRQQIAALSRYFGSGRARDGASIRVHRRPPRSTA